MSNCCRRHRRRLSKKGIGGLLAGFLGICLLSAPLQAIACLDNDDLAVSPTAGDGAALVVDQSISAAEHALRIGYQERAISLLKRSVMTAKGLKDDRRQAAGLAALANGYVMRGQLAKARECLADHVALAEKLGDPALMSLAYLNLGNLEVANHNRSQNYQQIAGYFQRAIIEAREARRPDLVAKARLNRAHFQIERHEVTQALNDLEVLDDVIATVLDLVERTTLFLTLGHRWLDLSRLDTRQAAFAKKARSYLGQALYIAQTEQIASLEAPILGALGQLYDHANRPDDALAMFIQAEGVARDLDAPFIGYPWSWAIARLLKEAGDRERALKAYKRAVDMVKGLRQSTADLYRRNEFTPTVLEDAEKLIADYISLFFADGYIPENQDELRDVRDAVEQQRQVEVESYFRDDCIADLRGRIHEVEANLTTDTALIYPIELEAQWVYLVQIGQSLDAVRLPASPEILAKAIKDFTRSLRQRNGAWDQKVALGKSLYNYLMAPIKPLLDERGIDTLVVVPSASLRSLPFAALHDGARFLIEDYALATIPGLSLLDSEPLGAGPIQALIGGLTTKVEGFSPLPNVTVEIDDVRKVFPKSTVLTGEAFRPDQLKRTLADTSFSVVHLASHAKLDRRSEESYVITDGNERFSLDDLELMLKPSQFRDRPVELLTLSACETAAGVDQDEAALGLAGIAVKAGARSALGTLWKVADASSPMLMREFYQALAQPDRSMTKAKALQEAQLVVLSTSQYRDPYYWAPYLLIGNWR